MAWETGVKMVTSMDTLLVCLGSLTGARKFYCRDAVYNNKIYNKFICYTS